jgi:putative membrane protein
MKRMSTYAVAFTAAISLAACGGAGDDRRTAADDQRTAPGMDAPATGGDAGTGTGLGTAMGMGGNQDFVRRAAEKNHAEIELSRLAQQRASNPQVRQYAQTMVDEHTKALEELRQVAQRENVQLTEELADDQREKRDRLQNLKGAEFDREYMQIMVDSHEEMRDLLEDRADRTGDRAAAGTADRPAAEQDRDRGTVGTTGAPQGGDAQLNQWASKTLPVVQKHHERAQQLLKQVQNTGQQRR